MSRPGSHMSIKLAIVCAAVPLLVTALAGPAEARKGRDQCAGILHQDGSRLWFGGERGEGEGICMIAATQAGKVLKTCAAGRYCRVVGTTADCKDSGECSEINDIVSVTASRSRR